MPAIARRLQDAPCFRISAADTNYFAVLADPSIAGVHWITVIEIFEPGGRTPPNSHSRAWEQFLVLAGQGVARCDGTETPLMRGDTLILPPGSVHEVENTGPGKLYCLTTMFPNQDFAELIRAGVPATLDAADLALLGAV